MVYINAEFCNQGAFFRVFRELRKSLQNISIFAIFKTFAQSFCKLRYMLASFTYENNFWTYEKKKSGRTKKFWTYETKLDIRKTNCWTYETNFSYVQLLMFCFVRKKSYVHFFHNILLSGSKSEISKRPMKNRKDIWDFNNSD